MSEAGILLTPGMLPLCSSLMPRPPCTLQCRPQDPDAATSHCTLMTSCTVFPADRSMVGSIRGLKQYGAKQDYADRHR